MTVSVSMIFMAERKSSPLITIPPEIEAEMSPAVKAFVIAAFAKFEARIAILEATGGLVLCNILGRDIH